MNQFLRHVEMTGSDRRMDQQGDCGLPVNPLSPRCSTCTFPDLDRVPTPYRLSKGTSSPDEISLAEIGNFLVRERVRRILELVCPGQCEFVSTVDRRGQATEWWLTVPRHRARICGVRDTVPRCPDCGEPKVAHPGSHYLPIEPESADCDVFKSENWSSGEAIGEEAPWYRLRVLRWTRRERGAPGRWTRVQLARSLHFSVRLETLLKAMKVRGLVRTIGQPEQPDAADRVWVQSALQMLAHEGLVNVEAIHRSPALERWFRAYLKKHAGEGVETAEVEAVEAQQGVTLPSDYKSFVHRIGEKSFMDVDQQSGFVARVVRPASLDFRSLRNGSFEVSDEESGEVDGVIFATTDHGDCFCLNLAEAAPDYPVYLYDHDLNGFEAYAPSFAACIRRWDGS